MADRMKREGGKVWIEGVPTLGWGKGKECTFCGALEAAIAVSKHPHSYTDLMGYSGMACRVRWYRGRTGDKHCPSCAVGEMPDEIAAIARTTGWRMRAEVDFQDPKRMARFVPDIVASLDAGQPVIGYDEHLNCAAIVGHAGGGKTLLFHDYFRGDQVHEVPAENLGALLLFLTEPREAPARCEAVLDALNTAVRNWRREPKASEKGDYLYGAAALDAWGQDIAAADRFTEPERRHLFLVSWWAFSTLGDARREAAAFREAAAESLAGETREALRRAAAAYEQEGATLGPVFARKDAFLGPWSGKKIEDCTPEVREREQALLAEVRKLDEAAVAEIEKALAVETLRKAPE